MAGRAERIGKGGGRVRRVGVRAAPAIVGRVGQVRRVGQVGQVGRVGVRAAPAIVGRVRVRAALAIVGRVRVRAALAIVGRVGRVRLVRRVGVRAAPAIVGRVGQVRREGVVCFSVLGTVIRCLYFANFSLILRSSCILPISNIKGRCREKNFLFSDNLMIISFFS